MSVKSKSHSKAFPASPLKGLIKKGEEHIEINELIEAIQYLNSLYEIATAQSDTSLEFIRLLALLGKAHGNLFTEKDDAKAAVYLERANAELQIKISKWKPKIHKSGAGLEQNVKIKSFLTEIQCDLVTLYCNCDRLNKAEAIFNGLKDHPSLKVRAWGGGRCL